MDGFSRGNGGEYRQIHGLNRMMKWLKTTTGATLAVIIIAAGAPARSPGAKYFRGGGRAVPLIYF